MVFRSGSLMGAGRPESVTSGSASAPGVQFPGATHPPRTEHLSRIDDYDWPSVRQPYTVEWELDEAGWRLLFGPAEERGEGVLGSPGARRGKW